jgi:S1-C subfamily serine protease
LALQTLTPELAQRLGYSQDRTGVVVTGVEPGSAANRAGIRPKDVIVAVAGRAVENVAQFRDALKQENLADGVRLQVLTDGVRRFVFLRSDQAEKTR